MKDRYRYIVRFKVEDTMEVTANSPDEAVEKAGAYLPVDADIVGIDAESENLTELEKGVDG